MTALLSLAFLPFEPKNLVRAVGASSKYRYQLPTLRAEFIRFKFTKVDAKEVFERRHEASFQSVIEKEPACSQNSELNERVCQNAKSPQP